MTLRNFAAYVLTACLALVSLGAGASIINAGFKWTGQDSGYTVEGDFSYDGSSPNLIYAYGDTSQIQGLEYLAVSFYDPGHNLLFSTVDFSGGSFMYDSLIFNFDPVTNAFVSSFNMGSSAQDGDMYLSGGIGGTSYLVDYTSADILDTAVDTTIAIPEPSSFALLALGLGLLAGFRKNMPPKTVHLSI